MIPINSKHLLRLRILEVEQLKNVGKEENDRK